MRKSNNHQYLPIIQNLGLMNQYLISKYLDYGLIKEVTQLKNIEYQLLRLLEYKSANFDFVNALSHGKTLFVGEGNLSFTLSLISRNNINPRNITATTFENASELSGAAQTNMANLKRGGANIINGVDATNLKNHFGMAKFDNIIFQFPHTASREAVDGHNPNFILVRDFLISASQQLSPGGQIIISAVDSPHYRGAFQFTAAATAAGFSPPSVYEFDPRAFAGYEHTMTHQAGNALDNHDKFSSFVFRKA
jgi:hypothetical protein